MTLAQLLDYLSSYMMRWYIATGQTTVVVLLRADRDYTIHLSPTEPDTPVGHYWFNTIKLRQNIGDAAKGVHRQTWHEVDFLPTQVYMHLTPNDYVEPLGSPNSTTLDPAGSTLEAPVVLVNSPTHPFEPLTKSLLDAVADRFSDNENAVESYEANRSGRHEVGSLRVTNIEGDGDVVNKQWFLKKLQFLVNRLDGAVKALDSEYESRIPILERTLEEIKGRLLNVGDTSTIVRSNGATFTGKAYGHLTMRPPLMDDEAVMWKWLLAGRSVENCECDWPEEVIVFD